MQHPSYYAVINALCALEARLPKQPGSEGWAFPRPVVGATATQDLFGIMVTVKQASPNLLTYSIDNRRVAFGVMLARLCDMAALQAQRIAELKL